VTDENLLIRTMVLDNDLNEEILQSILVVYYDMHGRKSRVVSGTK
jgi:hypothetical protein